MKTLFQLLAIGIVLCLGGPLFSQGWQQVYPQYQDAGSFGFTARDVAPLPNGNAIILITGGGTYSLTAEYYVIEINANGEVLREATFSDGPQNNPSALIQTSDGGYLIANTFPNAQNTGTATRMVKLDANFNISFNTQIDDITTRVLVENSNAEYWLVGTQRLIKMDALGNPLDTITDGLTDFYSRGAVATTNGGVQIIGYGKVNGSAHSMTRIYAYDNAGNLIDQSIFDHNNEQLIPSDMISSADGGYMVTARNRLNDPMLFKLDQNLDEQWRKDYDPANFLIFTRITPTIDNQGYRIAFQESGLGLTERSGLIETDLNGNWLWQRTYYENFSNNHREMILLADGGSLIVGERLRTISPYTTSVIPLLLRTDNAGFTADSGVAGMVENDDDNDCLGDNFNNVEDRTIIAWQGNTQINSGIVDDQGNFDITLNPGNYRIEPVLPNVLWSSCQDSLNITVVSNDTLGGQDFVIAYTTTTLDSVYGYVFEDIDGDCFKDSFETMGYAGIKVSLEVSEDGMNETFVDTTDANGYYLFDDLSPFTNGAYKFIHFSRPVGTGYDCQFYPCRQETDLPITTSSSYNHNTGVRCDTLPPCPIMEVNMGTNQIRPCLSGSYWVYYCNIGANSAVDAYLEVTIDSQLVVTGSSIPWSSQNGNVYTFDFSYIPSNECGSFRVNFFTPCDAITGTTYCSEVYAYPDSTCAPPDPNWDQSEIELSAACLGDSVEFTIQNIGSGNMSSPLEYVIIEDNVLLMNQPEIFQLNVGEIRRVTTPVNGDFYRMESMQPDGFPGNATPVSWVEGCGDGNPDIGFTNQFSLGDDDSWYDIFCQQSVNSYDPNDKQGFPLGVLAENYIDQNQSIEYLIRFQNTGTAEAINIEIRDTIATAFLNPVTVRPGASSHDYIWDMQGNGVVVFHFLNINLPDSTTNEAASQGFVQFTVQQRLDNPIGTEIKNSAAIYFDNNPPIITNETLHTIGEDYLDLIPVAVTSADAPSQVSLVPNPAGNYVQVFSSGKNSEKQMQVEIYTALGGKVLSQNLDNGAFLNIGTLAPGAYFYQVMVDDEKIGFGKMIKL